MARKRRYSDLIADAALEPVVAVETVEPIAVPEPEPVKVIVREKRPAVDYKVLETPIRAKDLEAILDRWGKENFRIEWVLESQQTIILSRPIEIEVETELEEK